VGADEGTSAVPTIKDTLAGHGDSSSASEVGTGIARGKDIVRSTNTRAHARARAVSCSPCFEVRCIPRDPCASGTTASASSPPASNTHRARGGYMRLAAMPDGLRSDGYRIRCLQTTRWTMSTLVFIVVFSSRWRLALVARGLRGSVGHGLGVCDECESVRCASRVE
jgi:hypothetical protein